MAGFYQRFRQSAERWPENVAIEVQPAHGLVESWSYAELRRRAESVGQWLRQHSAADFAGTRCALLAANGPRWVAAYLGVLAAGGIAVPLDTAFHPEQVATLLQDSGSSILFTDIPHLATAQAAQKLLPELPVEVILLEAGDTSAAMASLDSMFAASRDGFVAAEPTSEDVAVILYTSGTTSDPKGVMLTHANLQAEADAVFQLLQVGPGDAILGVLPLFHALAQMANLLLPFAAGMRVVYLETLNTAELLRGLRERKITFFCCVPQFFYLIHERVMKQVSERPHAQRTLFAALLWLSRRLRKIGINAGKAFFRQVHTLLGTEMRYLITGGSRFDLRIARDLDALGFNILQAYGLTETSGGAVVTPPRENVLGSVGKPLPGVEIKIVGTEASEDSTQSGAGEIAIRGGIVMKGYYNRPQATAEVLRDGWLYSGDLGRLDRRRNLFITGRKKDVIVLSSGKNVYPEEIEAHYLQSPYIKEMCVIGLESKGGKEPLGERLHAVIVPNFDLLRERKIVNTSQVIRFDIETLSAQLPSTKRILSYDLWQHELPRTSTRKLKRFQIQQQVAQQASMAEESAVTPLPVKRLSAADESWLAQPEVERAVAIVRSNAKGRGGNSRGIIRPDDNLELDLGFDSMERVELLVALEHELGAEVEDSVVSQVYTVRELVEAVLAGMGAAPGSKRSIRAGWQDLLATESGEPEVLSLSRPRPLSALFWFTLTRLFRIAARVLFRLRVEGREKLPDSGPFIISPNHQSYFDAIALVSVLPWRLVKESFYVGTSEIFASGVWRLLARSLRLITIDPDANLVPAMRAGAYGLRRGKILVLFPEGERSIDGTPKVFRKGAAILASHLNVPIVPVAMAGFYGSWPRGKSFQKFARWRIRFDQPLVPLAPGGDAESTYQQLTAQLRSRVVEMWEQISESKPGLAQSAKTG